MVIMTTVRRSSTKRASSWQEKLFQLDLNHLHKSRTCEVFFMVESDETCSPAIDKFKNGSKLDQMNSLKSINFEDILKNIEIFSQDSTPHPKIEHILYRNVAQKATSYLKNNEPIPRELLANLIKLQIAFKIHEDVVLTQKKILWAQNLEKEAAGLVQQMEPADKGKKGKGKEKDKKGKDKGKDKKGKGGKNDAEKIYDVCDSNNEIKFKPTSKIAKETKDNNSVAHETISLDPKHLFVVIVGFYDFHLIEELHKIGVQITGIVELTKPSIEEKSTLLFEEECEDLGKNLNYEGSQKSFLDKTGISHFWNKIYEYLEGPDGCPSYLNNIIHMTVSLPEESFDEPTCEDRHHLNVFSDIGTAIIKSPDIQRQHVNYIRNLKICPVGPTPTKMQPSHFETYNKILNIFPPDCFNIFAIVHALVEEVRQRVPDPPQIILETPPPSSVTEFGTSDQESLKVNSKMYHGIKGEIAKILNTNFKNHNKKSDNDDDEEHNFDPKLNIKISNKPFLAQENNDIEIMANSYEKLRPKLLHINIEKLVMSSASVLLWKGYPYIEEEQQKMLTKIYRLQAVADTLDVPLHELQYVIHTILFNSFKCKNLKNYSNDNNEDSCSLQLIFPQKSSMMTHNVVKKHIPCKHTIETLETSEEILDMEIPYVPYLDKPNLYEAKNLSTYKWYETLSSMVILQELFKAEHNYLCVDYKYCTFDDSILLRYHNDLDEFGINTKIWDQSLRTPISSLREFCKYVIHVNSKWIEQQEEKHVDKLERDFECAIKENHKMKQNFYPDLIFTDKDFIQSRSIKGRILEELKKPILSVEPAKKSGKSDKKDKGKGKDSKATSGKGKGKGEKAAPATQIVLLEKLSKPPPPPERRKLSLRCANHEEPFSFYAYDVSNSQVQITGSTTVFQSQDGFKVTVDQTRFIGTPRKLSFNISMNDHSLILHYHQATMLEPFTFHFALSDQTIIAFAKPLQISPPEEKLGEKIYQALKRKKDEKRQEIYFISERQCSVLKCFSIPYITRRNLILSEDLIIPFLNQLSTRGIKTQLAPTEMLSSSEIEKFEDALSSTGSTKSLTSSTSQIKSIDRPAPPKYCYDVISKVIECESVLKVEEEKEKEQILEELVKSTRSLSEDSVVTTPLRRSNKKLLKKIRKVVESHLPIFKICSSKLHRHQYVKRIKSRIEIPIGTILKRIPCKAALYKPTVDLKISKLLPVKPSRSKPTPTKYDIKISLPSGLSIQSIEGTEGSPFNIRQSYCDKGPQCKNIAHEYSRTFTRSGNIIIKKCDGNVDVLGVGGQIVKCEIPYLKVKSVLRPREKQSPKRTANHLIPLHTSSLTTFQKQLNRSINRLRKHLIDGYKSQRLLSHRACQRWKKNYIKDAKQVYILQNSVGNLKKFSLITSDGKKLNVTPSIISEEKIYYTSTATDYRYQEIYHGREDGTHSIMKNHESLLVTQFPDGTRLTTWIEIERDLLYLEEREREVVEGNTRNEEQQVYEYDLETTIDVPENASEKDSLERFSTMTFQSETTAEEHSTQSLDSLKTPINEGWVSVHLNMKYEHPNYATIIYYGIDDHSEIILPNNVKITASSKGEYITNIDHNISTKITTEQILLEARLCKACLQKSTNKLNIKPLYYKSGLNPHKTELLRTTDTFKKVFIVNYDGQCFRNVNYQQGRINLAACKNHSNFEHQKLFILTRSLIGCKLWDINSYRARLAKAKRSGSDLHEGVSRTEIRNYVKKPFHERFLIPYHELTLVLTKNKPKEHPTKDLAYVTRQVINKLPESSKFYHIYSTLLKLGSKKSTRLSETIISEFATFLNHVVDGILGKHKKPSDFVKKVSKVPSVHVQKLDSVPFGVKHQKWAKECAKHWKDIREQTIPKYFNSKYFNLVSGITPHSSESNSSSETICECNENPERSSTLCNCGKIGFTNPDGSFVKTVHTIDTHETITEPSITLQSFPEPDTSFGPFSEKENVLILSSGSISAKESALTNKSSTTSLITSKESTLTNKTSITTSLLTSISEKNSTSSVTDHTSSVPSRSISSDDTNPESPKIEPWYETALGKSLLTEIKTKMIKIALETPETTFEDVSAEKIERATNQLVNDLMMVVQKYETNSTGDDLDYITIAVNTVSDKILDMQLNPIELILLLDSVERENLPEEISKLCSPTLASTVTAEEVGDLVNIIQPCKASTNKMERNQESSQEDLCSYFGVYGYYSNIEEVSKPKPKEEPLTLKPALKMVFEKEESQDEVSSLNAQNNTVECVQGDGIDISCTSDIPCHSEDKLPFKKYDKKCEKYIEYTEPEQTHRDSSKASVRYSQSDVIFSIPSFDESGNSAATVSTMSSRLANISSDTIPMNIEISPESSLLEYCLSENLATIDGGTTMVLQKNDHDETPSMMVMFSVVSLKEKEVENPLPGPYIQRNPDDAAEMIENIVANTKMSAQAQQLTEYQPINADLPRQPERDTSKSLLNKESLHKCQKCIIQLEEELSKSESLSNFKTKSVVSLLAALKRAKSDDTLSSANKEKITTSIMNIIENLSVKPRTGKYTSGRIVSKISDEDVKISKGIHPCGSRTLLTPSRIRGEVTRRTVGSQTQPKVERMNQT